MGLHTIANQKAGLSTQKFVEEAHGLGAATGGQFFVGNMILREIGKFAMVPLIQNAPDIFG